MKRFAVTLVCLLALSSIPGPPIAEATPLYHRVFKELYFPRAPKAKVSCAACHPRKSKRELNRYSRTLAEELKGKNVKDPVVIARAMKAIEHLFPGLPKSGD